VLKQTDEQLYAAKRYGAEMFRYLCSQAHPCLLKVERRAQLSSNFATMHTAPMISMSQVWTISMPLTPDCSWCTTDDSRLEDPQHSMQLASRLILQTL
jgi:hypothetical protein